ncbi:universal stress protein [Streptomyces sp. NPDC059649]|uniref:universal stress protein n=1 Tax=Streptomyces sp. NPDC059649 TaxID=3346895 RepID=UPI0036A309AD
MELPLVVGVDGSDSSLEAVDWAVEEAARHGVPLRLVHASRWERYEGVQPSFATDRPADQVLAEHIVASCEERARLRDQGVKVSGVVVPDDAVSALQSAGREAFALVTGSRGRGGLAGLLLGSVSLALAARAVCPVIVVRGAEQNRQGAFHQVVLGVGDTPGQSAAIRFAFRESEVRQGTLRAIHAWRLPAHETADSALPTDSAVRSHEERASALLAEALRTAASDHPAVEVHQQATEGPAQRVLLDATAQADLLVVGALRRHGHFGLQLGRVNHTVLHHSACPVAVVPQRA